MPRDADALRSDARENRARILAAALEGLTDSPDASLNSIAKRAGVGIGTLYRHFPTREALLLAVYRREVQQLVDAGPELLAAEPPLTALRSWLDRLAYYGRAKAGLKDALAAAHDRLNAETYGPVVGALAALLEANERAGTVRAGLDADDVLLMLGFLWRVDPGPEGQERARRLLDITVDGLRAGGPIP